MQVLNSYLRLTLSGGGGVNYHMLPNHSARGEDVSLVVFMPVGLLFTPLCLVPSVLATCIKCGCTVCLGRLPCGQVHFMAKSTACCYGGGGSGN